MRFSLRTCAPNRVEHLVPRTILRRVTDHTAFLGDLTRYTEMSDGELLHATEVCLRNLEHVDDPGVGPDGHLRLVLVPELWERLRAGSRDKLRRISSTLAEYDPTRPLTLARFLSSETRARLRDDANALRQRVAFAGRLDVGALVEQVRFAIAGSRVADRWAPTDFVYEPGFVYRLVPAIAWRALVHQDPAPPAGAVEPRSPQR